MNERILYPLRSRTPTLPHSHTPTRLLILALWLLSAGIAHAQSRPAWWSDSWRWRALVQVSGGASSVWLTTGARARPDGADIWLIGPNGRAVPCAFVHSDAGRHLLTFDAGQGGKGGLFAFYYGNPDATPAPRAPIPRGMFLKTRRSRRAPT